MNILTESKEVIANKGPAKKDKKITIINLNKSEASHYLHNLYEECIEALEIDNTHPDFYSLITENLRDPVSASAIEQGYPRGNRASYSNIPCIRIGNRPMFFKSKLKEWFNMHYAPKLLKTAA